MTRRCAFYSAIAAAAAFSVALLGFVPRVAAGPGRIENVGNHAVERGAIGAKRAFRCETFTHAHDRHAVVPETSTMSPGLARSRSSFTRPHPRIQWC